MKRILAGLSLVAASFAPPATAAPEWKAHGLLDLAWSARG